MDRRGVAGGLFGARAVGDWKGVGEGRWRELKTGS